jgi:hypothetical protein
MAYIIQEVPGRTNSLWYDTDRIENDVSNSLLRRERFYQAVAYQR